MSNAKKYRFEPEGAQAFNEIDLSRTYSYASYLKWVFDERVELIKGKVFQMSPAPAPNHQLILGNIFLPLGNFLKRKTCRVFIAPFDVRFPSNGTKDEDIYTVLQPDLCVVCDANKIDARGCMGAPDLVIEILSPGNNRKELLHKYQIYEEFGVKEYWVVSQSDQSLLIYTLETDGKFRPSKLFTLSETVTSSVLPGFSVTLDDVFEGIPAQ